MIEPRPYPTDVLAGCETGLLFFGAGLLGANDGIHFRDAGIRAAVVDRDRDMLARMAPEYPREWIFFGADTFEWAETFRAEGGYADAVSVDPPLGQCEKALEHLSLWLAIARKALTLTVLNPVPRAGALLAFAAEIEEAKRDWRCSFFKRNSRVSWLVMVPDA